MFKCQLVNKLKCNFEMLDLLHYVILNIFVLSCVYAMYIPLDVFLLFCQCREIVLRWLSGWGDFDKNFLNNTLWHCVMFECNCTILFFALALLVSQCQWDASTNGSMSRIFLKICKSGNYFKSLSKGTKL